MDGPQIETARLLLRPHRITDRQHVERLWADPEVTRWIGGRPSTPEESWARLLRYIGHWTAFGFGYFQVAERDGGTVLGEVGLMDHRRDIEPSLEGVAEAGWVMAPHAWARGIAGEALAAMLGWYRTTSAPRPVACIIAPGNTASIRLARRCGFVEAAETRYRGQPTLVMRLG